MNWDRLSLFVSLACMAHAAGWGVVQLFRAFARVRAKKAYPGWAALSDLAYLFALAYMLARVSSGHSSLGFGLLVYIAGEITRRWGTRADSDRSIGVGVKRASNDSIGDPG